MGPVDRIDAWITTGYCASLYRWGTDCTRMEESVVTETRLPDLVGP